MITTVTLSIQRCIVLLILICDIVACIGQTQIAIGASDPKVTEFVRIEPFKNIRSKQDHIDRFPVSVHSSRDS